MTTTIGMQIGPLGLYRPLRKQRPGIIMQMFVWPFILMVWMLQLMLWMIKVVAVLTVTGARVLTTGHSRPRHARPGR